MLWLEIYTENYISQKMECIILVKRVTIYLLECIKIYIHGTKITAVYTSSIV